LQEPSGFQRRTRQQEIRAILNDLFIEDSFDVEDEPIVQPSDAVKERHRATTGSMQLERISVSSD
jgi:hypothetical protein